MDIILNELPPEVWGHILSHISDFNDVINSKVVNRLFYEELSAVDLITMVSAFLKSIHRSINMSEKTLKYFVYRDLSHKQPRETLLHALKYNMVPTLDGKTILFNVFFQGADSPGVTSFIQVLLGEIFTEKTTTFYGLYPRHKTYVDPDGIRTKLQLRDMGSSSNNYNIARTYLKGTNAMVLCFAINYRASLVDVIIRWLPALSSKFGPLKPEEQPLIYLLGLKSDLEDQRQVSTKEAKAVARALRMKYFECSSKLNHNVSEVMEEVKNDLLATIRLSMNASNTKTDASESKRWCLVQ